LARLNVKQTYTLAIEVGAQNAMLGVAIAISPFLLDNARIAMVPSIYAVTMVLILSLFVALSKHFRTDMPDESTTI
jgi:bile acid:Na+ symporter, BASS family